MSSVENFANHSYARFASTTTTTTAPINDLFRVPTRITCCKH